MEQRLIAGKYRLERELGAGGMGTVWIAIQEPLGRRVAVKEIGGVLDPVARARFEREAKIVASMRCPHVVTLFDFGEHEGVPYIVMELLDGETLRERISRGPLAIDDALNVARDIACGLRSAHELGVIHHDLKPENVILVPDKDRGTRAKLLDFGIAREVTLAADAGHVAGTPGFIAPEVVRGAQSDARVDLYALGVIAFEMLAGKHPITAASPLALIAAHCIEPCPDVRTARAEVSAALASLVARLLAKDPEGRPSDADTVVREIDALRTGSAPTVALTPLSEALGQALQAPDRPSIAVQPFAAHGGTDDDVFFGEGISEDILDALSRFKALFVVSRFSMVQPDGRDTDPIRVARTLGVRYVVQGSVRRAGDRLRVAAKLVDATTGAQLWANRYDVAAGDFFDVQDAITENVVACVAGHVEAAHTEHARRRPPHTLAAYDWLARGRYHHHKRSLEDNARARDAIEHAVHLDPEFAQAHAWRACIYGQAAAMGDPNAHPIVVQSLNQALALDEGDAECHRMACEIAFMEGDLVRAEHHHRRAFSMNPNDSRVVGQAGELALYQGHLAVAASALLRAARLDPLSPKPYLNLLARVRYLEGDWAEAQGLFRCVHDGPMSASGLAFSAAVGVLLGQDVSELVASARAAGFTFKDPPFADAALRAKWRSGFVVAGLAS